MLIVKTVDILEAPPGPAIRFRNFYECGRDGTKWHDEWTCSCNDRCPACDTEIEPYFSQELEAA